jgi:pyruvate,water dikinase
MTPLVLSLDAIGASDLERVGGKAANLGELLRAGFPVPDGFVLTTEAYRQAAQAAAVDPNHPEDAADRLRSAPVPESIAADATHAYASLGHGPVAVRSSATAEDLPGASFAGQQDTYLNVSGEAALLDAIRRCWASLWNSRAVAYRHANGLGSASVSLAVVVQKLVSASAAGVLFTADPLTGRRRRTAIDAIPELGERLVSGAVDPDHYVVDSLSRRILERRPRHAAAVLSDGELLELSAVGDRVETHFGVPQDVEFALDANRRIWLVQARPITTLYPLPTGQPDPERDLRVYFSANVFQGYFEPLTPMGMQFFQLLGTSVFGRFGADVADPIAGPAALVEAGMRLFIDVTPVVRDPLGQRLFASILSAGEARSSVVLSRLMADPRLSTLGTSQLSTVRRVLAALRRAGVARAALPVLRRPLAARARYEREMDAMTRLDLPPDADSTTRLNAFEWLLLRAAPRLLPRLLGIMAPAMLTFGLTHVLLRGVARGDEIQTLTRGAPYNPTTEMDLALWALSHDVRGDHASRAALLEGEPARLATAFQQGGLPARLQHGLAAFLARYGFRSIGEIDIGVQRWAEDPTHILGALANYVRLDDASLAPDAQFARSQRAAEAKLAEVVGRVHGPKRLVVTWALRRLRVTIGSREAPKFHIIRLLATPARDLLRPVGVDLAARGLLASPDDIFFLRLPEARRAVAGEDLRSVVAPRRQAFDRERARRHLPRVLLSDGTDAEAALVLPADGQGLHGSPASPGRLSGTARVIRSPLGARLEPGEILVAPSTDPGWTPLFLTAGGLVMEMGGMMSHGAVVAREYGIPAVVGVAGATDQIRTGQRVTIDGSAGTVVVDS